MRLMQFVEAIFAFFIVSSCAFVIYLSACAPPAPPAPDTSKFRFVICSDIFGATLYDGAASEVWVKDGAVHVVEPSGTEVVLVNVECIIVKGTRDQIDKSMHDHGVTEEAPPDDDDSF